MTNRAVIFTFLRDSLFATIWVFAFLFFGKLILVNSHALNPFDLAITDFDLIDIAYSKLGLNKTQAKDNNVIILNIGNDDRVEIAREIEILRKFKPRVIALDAVFEQRSKSDKGRYADSVLKETINRTTNLVSGQYFTYNNISGDMNYDSLNSSDPYFNLSGREGFMNLIGAKKYNTIRSFAPQFVSGSTNMLSLTAKIMEKYDPVKFRDLINRKPFKQVINYSGDIRHYIVFDSADIFEDNKNLEFLRDKILLLGFCKKGNSNTDFTDKHFTPLNDNYAGRSLPDMYGVIIHANILSMILDNRFIYEVPRSGMYFISFFICFMFVMFYQYIFVKYHYWYAGVANLIVLISTVCVFLLSILLYSKGRIKIDDTVIIIPFALGVELIYFYEMFIKLLHKRYSFESHFTKNASH